MSIKELDKNTIRHLNSGQGIINLESIVKEFLENSIDANATSIELLFVENGLESIQIRDNGSGISESDRSFVAKRYYTSKISEFNDLENLLTFGFRGEALNSICSISSKVTLTTKTKQDPIGKQYDLDNEGNLSSPKSSNLIPTCGTIIQLLRPFYHLPVRRQLAHKNASQNMKKMHELITKYALSYPNIRFSYHSKSVQNQQQASWIKPVTKSIENSISIVFTAQLSNMLENFIETEDALTIQLIIPKPNSDPLIIYKEDRVFVYVNQRPINYVQSELKDVIALIKNRYRETIGLSDSNKKLPFIYLDIQLLPSEYDVNVEPSKTTILFHNKQLVYNLVEKVMDEIYPTKINKFFNVQPQKPSIKPRIISIDPEEEEEAEEPLFMAPDKQQQKGSIMLKEDSEDEVPLFMNQIDEHQLQRLLATHLDDDDDPVTPNIPPIGDENEPNATSDNDEGSVIGATPQGPSVSSERASASPERMSTPIENMERSFTFSMGSEEEDDSEDDIDEITRNFLQQNDLRSDQKNTEPVKRTLIDHWQIDDTQSVAAPTQALLDKPTLVTVPGSSANAYTPPPPFEKQVSSPLSPIFAKPPSPEKQASSPLSPTVAKVSSPIVIKEKRTSEKLPTSSFWKSKPVPLVETPSAKRSLDIPQESTVSKKLKSVPSISSPFRDPSPKDLSRTLNQTQTISCSLDKIKANYKVHNSNKYRVRIEDCLFKSEGGPITNLLRVPKLAKYGVTLYTRGKQEAQVNEIGIVKLKLLQVNRIFKELMKDHRLLCKSTLDRPVQIQFASEDELCHVILSLKSKEVYIKDDQHGNKNITFSEITDERVLFNGFKARWRKDTFTDHIVVQLTGIYSLGSGYGPSDFRELLSNLEQRPNKVEQHLWTLAHEICKTQQEDASDRILNELNALFWDKDQAGDWDIGYSNTHETIACKLKKRK